MRLTIPKPCHQSWADMTPASGGRHCAACQQTVIDFTQQSDAEILAYLARAAGSRLCGRFAAGQLERPLQRAAPAAPRRWRAWLAAALAVWGLREVSGGEAKAQVPTEQRELSANSPLNYSARPDYEGQVASRVLRGRVVDAETGEGLPGVTMVIKGTSIGTGSDNNGQFILTVPPEYKLVDNTQLVFQYLGYDTEEHSISLGAVHEFQVKMAIRHTIGLPELRPRPWHPREFYYWTKWKLGSLFSRSSAAR